MVSTVSVYSNYSRTALDCIEIQGDCKLCNLPEDIKPYCKMKETLVKIKENIGNPQKKIIKEDKLTGFCVDEDCSYCEIIPNDKIEIFCKHKYKLKKVKPSLQFRCKFFEKNEHKEEKPAMTEKKEIRIPKLSRRENEVMELLKEGLSFDEIPKKLNISKASVDVYKSSIKHKFKTLINYDPNKSIFEQIIEYTNKTHFVESDDSENTDIDSIVDKKPKDYGYNTTKAQVVSQSEKRKRRQRDSVDIDLIKPEKLTEREMEVLNFLVDGMTNNEIAGKLFVSECTVKAHVINIMNKMGATTRNGAAMRAIRLGLFSENATIKPQNTECKEEKIEIKIEQTNYDKNLIILRAIERIGQELLNIAKELKAS